MICYRDMAFCSSDCLNTECFRHETNTLPNKNLPIDWIDFSERCEMYQPPEPPK